LTYTAASHGNVDALNAPGVATVNANYPTSARLTAPAASRQPLMNVCAGVPANPWCSKVTGIEIVPSDTTASPTRTASCEPVSRDRLDTLHW